MSLFADFDFKNFWDNNEHAQKNNISEPLTDELLAEVENELGFKLPNDYVEFMRYQNGGIPKKQLFVTKTPTALGEHYVWISGILGIGKVKPYSLCGELGSQSAIDDCGYPDNCVYFGECPSAGHDMVAFDYSDCGKNGEPCVVHIDQECDYHKTFLAKDFRAFVKGLINEDDFYEDDEFDD